MTVYGLIIFIIGVIFIVVGAGLIIYSVLTKGATAGTRGKAQVEESKLKIILDFVLKVLEFIGLHIPPNQVANAGLVLIIIGIGLVILPAVIPGL